VGKKATSGAVETTQPNLSGMDARKASTKLAAGPESATSIKAARECSWMRRGLIGTGLAQPNPVKSSIRLPIASRWLSGLSVRRP